MPSKRILRSKPAAQALTDAITKTSIFKCADDFAKVMHFITYGFVLPSWIIVIIKLSFWLTYIGKTKTKAEQVEPDGSDWFACLENSMLLYQVML